MPAVKGTQRRKLTYASVDTQTDNISSCEEISDYQKEIEVLTKKIHNYEALVNKLQTENSLLKKQNDEFSKLTCPDTSSNNDSAPVSIEVQSVSSDVGNKPIKGCSCKGSCANKICGCVKKGFSCDSKLCKCDNVRCKNQEIEKENAADQNEQDHQRVIEKLGHLTLNQEILHVSKKKKKYLLSDCKNANENIERYSASPLSLGTRRRLFDQNSDGAVDILVPDSNSHSNDECSNQPEIETPHPSITKRSVKVKDRNQQFKIVVTTKEIQNDIQLPLEDKVKADDIFLPKIAKVIHSPPEKAIKISNPSDDFIVQRKYNNNKVLQSMASAISNEEISEKRSEENKIGIGPSPKSLSNYQVLESAIRSPLLPLSNTSDSNKHNSNTNMLDVSLNPMIPKRQLPRSPIGSTGILSNESKRFSPPKKELAVAEVDWEQHQSELIACTVCKRKFFPHRIDKHISSCKGI